MSNNRETETLSSERFLTKSAVLFISLLLCTLLLTACNVGSKQIKVIDLSKNAIEEKVELKARFERRDMEYILDNQIQIYLIAGNCDGKNYYPSEPLYYGDYFSSYEYARDKLDKDKSAVITLTSKIPKMVFDNQSYDCFWVEGSSFFGFSKIYLEPM